MFTELYGNKIGQISTDSPITEYPIPTANNAPVGVISSTGGFSLYYTESNGNKIGDIVWTLG